jgi:multisubunit Na+/H+ antiporter MnhB subunit
VVNVILVDFRALDTLGEITVLGIAAVAIAAILDRIELPGRLLDWEGRPWARGESLLLTVLTRRLLPLALLVSVYLLLRGHNLPGGGFIAGLVTGTAILTQYLAHGNDWVEMRLPPHYTSAAAIGIAIAAFYFEEVIPKSNGLPVHLWDLAAGKAASAWLAPSVFASSSASSTSAGSSDPSRLIARDCSLAIVTSVLQSA